MAKHSPRRQREYWRRLAFHARCVRRCKLPAGSCGCSRAPSSRFRAPIGGFAIPIMYFLARRKLQIANKLGSRALRADAVESLTCGWLASAVVTALLAQLLIGAWWV